MRSRSTRLGVTVEVLLCLGAAVGLATGAAAALPAAHPLWLRIVVAVGAVEVLLIWGGMVGTVVTQLRGHRQRDREACQRPAITTALAAFAAGRDTMAELTGLHRRHPRLVEDAVADLLGTLTPAARAPIVRVALALGMVTRWRRAARSHRRRRRAQAVAVLGTLPPVLAVDRLLAALDDPDEGVRRSALRGLVHTENPRILGDATRMVAARSVSERAVYVDQLRHHPGLLTPAVFEPALAADEPAIVIETLAMIRACGRTLALTHLADLLAHADARIRSAAAETVPYCTVSRTLVQALVRRLDDVAPAVRVAALHALARLAAHEALIPVARCLRSEEPAIAVAGAHALAALGPAGRLRLEAMILHGSPLAQTAAVEALHTGLAAHAQGSRPR